MLHAAIQYAIDVTPGGGTPLPAPALVPEISYGAIISSAIAVIGYVVLAARMFFRVEAIEKTLVGVTKILDELKQCPAKIEIQKYITDDLGRRMAEVEQHGYILAHQRGVARAKKEQE